MFYLKISKEVNDYGLAHNYIHKFVNLIFSNYTIINNLDKDVFYIYKYVYCCKKTFTFNEMSLIDFNKFKFIEEYIWYQ